MTLARIREMKESGADFFDSYVWDSDFAFLHDTPEWREWLQDAGLDEESLAAIEFEIPDFGD